VERIAAEGKDFNESVMRVLYRGTKLVLVGEVRDVRGRCIESFRWIVWIVASDCGSLRMTHEGSCGMSVEKIGDCGVASCAHSHRTVGERILKGCVDTIFVCFEDNVRKTEEGSLCLGGGVCACKCVRAGDRREVEGGDFEIGV